MAHAYPPKAHQGQLIYRQYDEIVDEFPKYELDKGKSKVDIVLILSGEKDR